MIPKPPTSSNTGHFSNEGGHFTWIIITFFLLSEKKKKRKLPSHFTKTTS